MRPRTCTTYMISLCRDWHPGTHTHTHQLMCGVPKKKVPKKKTRRRTISPKANLGANNRSQPRHKNDGAGLAQMHAFSLAALKVMHKAQIQSKTILE
jgi:hypothetical protein